jgi:hypothetical protein
MQGRCGAAIAIAAVWLLCSAVSAGAQSAGARYLFFSGADLWRNGSFLHGGVLWSPDGLDREGFTLKAMLSGGSYRYISGGLGGLEVTGRELTAQVMPGWRFKSGPTELKIFAGLDLQNHRLSPDDPGSGLRGNDVGLRTAFELWTEPTAQTMVSADGSVSTIVHTYSARAAAGWRVFGLFYAGPELQAFASDGYAQQRVGVHVTAFKTGTLEWSAATGYARDSDRRSSAYVRLGISTKR